MNIIKLLVIPLLLFCNTILHAEHLYFSTGFTPPVSDYYRDVLNEIDRRLEDITISFEVLPAERSLALVNQGINDGECCRIPPVVRAKYSNLREVGTSFFTARFSAFSRKDDLPISTFADLKPYSVAVPKGWKIVVNKATEVQPRELFVVTTPEQLFRMLDEDRAEVGVLGYLSGLHVIRQLQLVGIKAIKPPLVSKDLYIMLHEKHQSLIPIFDGVIKDMIEDGTIDRIYNNYQ